MGDMGEHAIKLKNLMTLSGVPLASSDVKNVQKVAATLKPQTESVSAEIASQMANSLISITGKAAPTDDSFVPDLLCIAGTWDDWMPKDMYWDQRQECHIYEVQLAGTAETKFGVNRGKAGTKRWNARPKTWCLGKVTGRYQIKVFTK